MQALARHGGPTARFCHTGQHEDLGQGILDAAGIVPDERLLRPAASDVGALLAGLTTAIGAALDRQRPQAVVVQGDTASAMAGAMAAFHRQIPVAHVEAGLRSGDITRPWPEEGYRRMIARLAHWHFAPTAAAANALVAEGVPADSVETVGNTVIDALYWALSCLDRDERLSHEALPLVERASKRPIVLATVHRRETGADELAAIAEGFRALVAREKVELIVPLHPRAENAVLRDLLARVPRVQIVEPLNYFAFVRLMRESRLIISDSGGIQEEATAMGRPLLVLRRETERPEAVESGAARLVGSDPELLLAEAQHALAAPMPLPSRVFGDGMASERIAARLGLDLLTARMRAA